MRTIRAAAVLCLAALSMAADKDPIADAASRLESEAAKAPPAVAAEFRLLGAQALKQARPALAKQFTGAALQQLQSAKAAPSLTVVRMLALSDAAEAAALVRKNAPAMMPTLIGTLAREKSPEAATLYREVVASQSASPKPADAMSLASLAGSMSALAPDAAADSLERLITAASAPGFGDNATLSATFLNGTQSIATTTPRDTILVAAGSRLMGIDPQRAAKFREALSKWEIKGPVQTRSINYGSAAPAQASPDAAEAQKLQQRVGQFRGMATDADRAKAALEVAAGIARLSNPQQRLGVAMGLSNLSTEGNLGKEALTAVAGAIAANIGGGGSNEYIQLAKYVRYEHVAKPISDPALEAADALLWLREAVQAGKTFSLTAMDGKTYSLAGLKGKVVLLNFWATWCPPCRKEMPDMEKLYREFQKDGFVVLAVSDEERATVEGFLQKQPYSFPVLLDSDRKVNEAYDVEGIPKSFLFDREGRIVARSIDMRTEPQFREMLKAAGLQ